jgi:hypothetical protein
LIPKSKQKDTLALGLIPHFYYFYFSNFWRLKV